MKTSAPFVRTPVALLRDYTHVSLPARFLWSVLMSYADNDGSRCFPGVARLAKNLTRDRKAVFRYLDELEEAGLIRRFSGRKAGEFATNSYRVLQPSSASRPIPALPKNPPCSQNGTAPCPQNGDTT